MTNYHQVGSANLTARARKYLKDRGISLKFAKSADARSLNPLETDLLFRCKHEALLLPVGNDYGVARVFDLPEDKGKFRTPYGQQVKLYEPPPPPRMKLDQIKNDIAIPLQLIEGPFKALCASEHGIPSVGFHGCWGWQKYRLPIAGLNQYKLAGRTVSPAMDADYIDNNNVGLALLALGDWLTAQGANVVMKKLPKVAGRTTGVDDFLTRKGTTAFHELQSHPWDSELVWELKERLCPFTDGGNAARLLYRYADDIRRAGGDWYTWNAERWLRGYDGVQEMMKETSRSIFEQSYHESQDPDRRKAMFKFAMKTDSAKGLRDAIKVAESSPLIAIDAGTFDSDPKLLGVANGTLDLVTGKLLQAAREQYVTKRAGTSYDPKATCPRWLKFIDRITNGEQARSSFLQRLAGYCLMGSGLDRKMFFLYGTGANGKTIYIETLLKLAGEYGAPTKADIIMATAKNTNGPESPSPFLTALRGMRLVTISEVDERSRLNESLVKDITGGDTIVTRTHRSEPIRFTPHFTVLVRGNHRPLVYGDDNAIWERLVIVPFEVCIPEAERDPHLSSALEAELSGILTWVVEGCREYQRIGLQLPDYVRNVSAEYRVDMDTFGRWMEECIEKSDSYEQRTVLYNSYKTWCENGSVMSISDRRFYAKLEERDFKRSKINGTRYIAGLKLISESAKAAKLAEAEKMMAEQQKSGGGRRAGKGIVSYLGPKSAR